MNLMHCSFPHEILCDFRHFLKEFIHHPQGCAHIREAIGSQEGSDKSRSAHVLEESGEMLGWCEVNDLGNNEEAFRTNSQIGIVGERFLDLFVYRLREAEEEGHVLLQRLAMNGPRAGWRIAFPLRNHIL